MIVDHLAEKHLQKIDESALVVPEGNTFPFSRIKTCTVKHHAQP